MGVLCPTAISAGVTAVTGARSIFWTRVFEWHGYEATREAAMAAFAQELATGIGVLFFLFFSSLAICGGPRADISAALLVAWVSLSPAACARTRAGTLLAPLVLWASCLPATCDGTYACMRYRRLVLRASSPHVA